MSWRRLIKRDFAILYRQVIWWYFLGGRKRTLQRAKEWREPLNQPQIDAMNRPLSLQPGSICEVDDPSNFTQIYGTVEHKRACERRYFYGATS